MGGIAIGAFALTALTVFAVGWIIDTIIQFRKRQ